MKHKHWLTILKNLLASSLLFLTLILITQFPFFSTQAQTSSTIFSLSPNEGVVIAGKIFYIDINLSSPTSQKLTLGRASLIFDPNKLEVTQIQYNSNNNSEGTLFCNYLQGTNDYIVDNQEGLIVVTGKSDGTDSCPYSQIDSTETIFARVYFRPLTAGLTNIGFDYTGQEEPRMTSLVDNQSPPLFLLSSKPNGASFTILENLPDNSGDGLPEVGIVSKSLLYTSSFVLLLSIIYVGYSAYNKRSK